MYSHPTQSSQLELPSKSGSFAILKSQVPLKDRNFLEQENVFIQLDHAKRQELAKQLKTDCTFLNDNNLMDYSLLLGVATPSLQDPLPTTFRCLQDQDGNLISFCIIDYLQQFNFWKYLENRYKSITKNQKTKKLISCVMPKEYCERFYIFINSLVVAVINH